MAGVFAAILFFTASSLVAQVPRIYEFLRYDASARAAAMGGSFMTVMNDPAAMYYNPATLNTIDSTQASFTFFKHLLDINSGFATIGFEIEGIGRVGAGVNFSSFGTFDRTDNTGKHGEFGASDIAVTVGWGSELGEGISAGISGKAIFSGIDTYRSSALALDGGLLYADTTRRLQIGLSILNLGSQLSSSGEEKETLPIDLKFGISHELRGLPLLIALNFSRLLDQSDSSKFIDRFSSFSVGGEFRISQPLRLRFGYTP